MGIINYPKTRSKKQCYSCGRMAVTWDIDIDAEQVDVDRSGIIHEYHCKECGARISVYVPFEES